MQFMVRIYHKLAKISESKQQTAANVEMLMSHNSDFVTAREGGDNSFMIKKERASKGAGKIRSVRSSPVEYVLNDSGVVVKGKLSE